MAEDSDASIEDDPVVEEIDVYLSKSLVSNLYLLQYPLRPKNVGYDSFDHVTARVKPKQKRIEIGLALDTKCENYCSSKGEQIAVNVDGSLPQNSSDRVFSGSKMDKLFLTCAPQTKAFTNVQYAVGLLKDGQLHVTPMDSVVQMRPSFEYLDKADTRVRAVAAAASADGGESSQDEGEDDAVPVSMKLARAESEEYKARQMASYEHINQKREEERWINVSYFSQDSGLSDAEREYLQAGDCPRLSQFKISSQEYLQALIPPCTEDKSEKPAMPDNVLSLNDLRKLDLNDQIKALLMNVKVIRFSELISFLDPGTDHQAVLRTLQNMAVLVQGCWVVKSEFLYPDSVKEENSRSRRPRGAASPELLRRVRDYAMWKFTHYKNVSRKDFSFIVQLSSDDVKEILEKMSRLKARTGWEFLYDYDRDFCESHPDIVQRQRSKWTLTYHNLAQHFKMPKDGDKKALELEMALMNKQTSERRTRRPSSRSPRKRTLSGRSLSDMSDVEVDPSFERNQLFDKSKTRDITKVEYHHIQGGKDDGLNPRRESNLNGPGIPVALQNGNGLSAANVNSLGVDSCFKGANSNCDTASLNDELEKFVKQMLTEHHVIAMSELRSLLSMYCARNTVGHVFNSGVSDKKIEQAVAAVGGIKLNNQWPPQSRPQPLFAIYTGHSYTDQLRRILFSLFAESFRFRSNTFRMKVKTETEIEPSEQEVKKFLKDHCEIVSGCYYLKGTLAMSS